MRWTAILLVAVFGCVPTFPAFAQKGTSAQKKVALVIGNDAYVSAGRLDNPARDARRLGARLQELGFKLVGDRAHVDLDKAGIDRALEAFSIRAQDADIALFYFSGHGMQIDGANYLVPIDLATFSPATVDLRTLNADLALRVMDQSGARVKIMLLDACRTNPFLKGKNQGGGLAQMKAPAGTVIGFATQPNTTASQGPVGGLSPYANALDQYLSVKGLELFSLLNEVGLAVMAATHSMQQPWMSSSPISGRIVLNPAGAPPPVIGHIPPAEQRVSEGAALSLVQDAYKQLDGKDYAGARQTLGEAIKIDGNFAPAYSFRGFAWYLEGRSKDSWDAVQAYRQGVVDFDTAIRLDQEYAPARRHRANAIVAIYRALGALNQPTNGILDRAIDDLRQAVRLDPKSKRSFNALGDAYLLNGAYSSAIESFNRAIELDPKYSSPYAGLCSAFRMLGKSREASKYAQLAAERDSSLKSKPCLTSQVSPRPGTTTASTTAPPRRSAP